MFVRKSQTFEAAAFEAAATFVALPNFGRLSAVFAKHKLQLHPVRVEQNSSCLCCIHDWTINAAFIIVCFSSAIDRSVVLIV